MDTAETADNSKQREHTMTEKGLELFHTTMDKHIQTLKRVSNLLKQSLEKYTKKSDDYISFLTHTKTAEATSELEEHTKFREDFVYKVEGLIRSSIAETTGFRPKSTLKEPSVKSQKKTSKKSLSKASLRSSNSSVLRQKAKISVETARKKLEFAQEESDLLTQKAEYEATCIIEKAKLAAKEKGLSARKEAAVAMAELNAIEEDETESESSDNGSEIVKNSINEKNTFKCVVNEISATATEELDLLLQYTGVHSRKQVISIKVANAGYPSIALERAWNRLDSRYGSPEKVENVLAEIRAVKEKPEYSALLSFYDTAVGVNPTISKLPAGLQSKWRDRAASYKRKHCVIFPPFTFFCDFVLEMAEVMNDPSFDFEFSGMSHEPRNRTNNRNVSVAKTEIVNNANTPKYILHVQKPNTRMRIYAIIDEQSNSSLVHGDILDYFDIKAESRQYSLSSCSGKVMMNGRRASGFVVQSLDGQNLELPTLIECDMIPNNRNEIPTCDVAANYQHLASIAQFIPPLDAEAKILLLIGRDLMQAHHVLDQKIGKPYQPYAQRLKLGWIIVGESCLDGAHIPKDAIVLKTFIHVNGKSSVLEPCSNLPNSLWLKGPDASFIDHIDEVPSSFPLVTPDEDCEVRILKTTVGKEVPFGIHRFEHFSTWISLVRAVTTLKTKLRTICFGQDKNRRQVTREESQHFILQAVQKEFFSDEISALSVGEPLHKHSKILNLALLG
ncbi:unnamed protein product [Mytilus coruscus]|uniref:Peptidase aspartic putative domain-containing protein n=1 Tax=Mytilus coruscus TaxID=42192 RepID=A0A6J8AWD2_MYTCO|nr:unnamed protein product [Mytilus coruscus]